jgi:hypothetical protein
MYPRDNPNVKKPPSILLGTTNVLLDSLVDSPENPGVEPLSRKVEV